MLLLMILFFNYIYFIAGQRERGPLIIILDIRISADASRRMYYFLLTIIITSVIQRINGANLKEHWAAQRNQVYKQQYQRLQHDTSLKYKMEFFLSSVQS